MKALYWSLASSAALMVLGSGPAQAIPAFARREGVHCQMCHFRLPELNEDGRAYVRRGLREEPPGEAAESGGGAEMEEPTRVPEAATDRELGAPLPFEWARYLTMMGHHMFVAGRGRRAEFEGGEMDIWAAGPLDRHWSGLLNPVFDIDAGESDVEQAYG